MAMIVLGVALLGTGAFFVYGLGHMEEQKTRRVALEVASARLDRLLAMDYAGVVSGAESGVSVGAYSGTVTTAVSEQSDGSPVYYYKTVTVTVSWQKQGRPFDVALTSIVGRRWTDAAD